MSVAVKTFSTEMGSLAYQNVYDWLDIYESLKYKGVTPKKDMPIAVREYQDELIDEMTTLGEHIERQIINWISSAIIQSRRVEEAAHMDNLLCGKLSHLGLIEPSVRQAQKTVNLKDRIEDFF